MTLTREYKKVVIMKKEEMDYKYPLLVLFPLLLSNSANHLPFKSTLANLRIPIRALSTTDMAILNADLPVRPPNAPPVPKPDEILKHPSLDARKKELQIGIKDVPFADIDPGVFNRQLVKLKLYAKPNPKHLEQPLVLGGGNITEGTYCGTQAVLTHAYSRIE